MSPILALVAVELLAVAAAVELLVGCMPRALRTASLENTYRVDGTISEHRQSREWRARNRLRRDLWAVFAYVLLIGNGAYFLIDKLVLPVPVVVSAIRSFDSDTEKWKASLDERRVAADLSYWQGQRHQSSVDQASDLYSTLRQRLPVVVLCGLALIPVTFIFLRLGIMKAYRDFAKGVKARDEKYFKIDMSRMAVSGSEFAVDVIAAHLNSQPRAS